MRGWVWSKSLIKGFQTKWEQNDADVSKPVPKLWKAEVTNQRWAAPPRQGPPSGCAYRSVQLDAQMSHSREPWRRCRKWTLAEPSPRQSGKFHSAVGRSWVSEIVGFCTPVCFSHWDFLFAIWDEESTREQNRTSEMIADFENDSFCSHSFNDLLVKSK